MTDTQSQEQNPEQAQEAKHEEHLTPLEIIPDSPDVITMPPFLVLLALIAGIVLDWMIPMSFGSVVFGWLGFIMLIICFSGITWCRKLFKAAETNISPNEPSHNIVTDGPYEYSRNPIYLCFLIGFTGLSFMADAPMMLILAVPLFFVLDQKVIQPEETYLTDKFGDTYTNYKKSVRRWL